ncbi:hypothetical protein [Streptomyces luteireticuli]
MTGTSTVHPYPQPAEGDPAPGDADTSAPTATGQRLLSVRRMTVHRRDGTYGVEGRGTVATERAPASARVRPGPPPTGEGRPRTVGRTPAGPVAPARTRALVPA